MMSDERHCSRCKHFGCGDDGGYVYGGVCKLPLPGPLAAEYHIHHPNRKVRPNYSCIAWELGPERRNATDSRVQDG